MSIHGCDPIVPTMFLLVSLYTLLTRVFLVFGFEHQKTLTTNTSRFKRVANVFAGSRDVFRDLEKRVEVSSMRVGKISVGSFMLVAELLSLLREHEVHVLNKN